MSMNLKTTLQLKVYRLSLKLTAKHRGNKKISPQELIKALSAGQSQSAPFSAVYEEVLYEEVLLPVLRS